MTRFELKPKDRLRSLPPRVWAVAICVLSLSVSLWGLLANLNMVVVADTEGQRRMLMTPSEDPTELMAMAGITAREGDDVFYTAYTGNRASLLIQRAFTVTVSADGKPVQVQLSEGTVADALAEAGVTLTEHDYTVPSLSTGLEPDMRISVNRVTYNDVVTETPIEPETVHKQTSLLCRQRWRTYVQQAGVPGVLTTTTRQRIVNGQIESTEELSAEVTVAPQDEIIMSYGAGVPISPLEAPEGVTVTNGVPSRYKTVHTGRATGYSSRGGRGASRLGLYCGTVAVDPNVIPYGSKLYITSTDGRFVYGWAIATDTGAAMAEGAALVDLYYETYMESRLSAVHQVNVYVVE